MFLKTNKAHSNLILPSEICNLSTTYMQQPKNGFDELSELIGMEKIVDRLKEIQAQVKVTLSNTNDGAPLSSYAFCWCARTGKDNHLQGLSVRFSLKMVFSAMAISLSIQPGSMW